MELDKNSFLTHALTPSNLGSLPKPDGLASATGPCGDSIELYIRLDGEVITDLRFMPHGCLHTVACGSVLTCLAKGRPLGKLDVIRAEEIEQALGGLDREHRHCAALAEAALKAAVRDCLRRRSEPPWKRIYGPQA